MKKLNTVMLVLVMGLICFVQTGWSDAQEQLDSIAFNSLLSHEKIDASSLSKIQLQDIWNKQVSKMYFIGKDGNLLSDKQYEWRKEKGWCLGTNMVNSCKSTNLTVKRGVGEGLWLAEDNSRNTIYVKPVRENVFFDGLKTNVFLNIVTQPAAIESDSGVKLNVSYYNVEELEVRRPTFKEFLFLLENGKSFTVVLPKSMTCPICNGTGSAKTTRKVGTRLMPVTEFCKTCNSRKTIALPLLSTLAK